MDCTVPDGKIRTLKQAAQLQRLAYDEAIALRQFHAKDLQEAVAKANALRSYAALWDTARDAVRIAKGKPLPGSLRPKAKERKRNPNRTGQANGHAEPTGPAEPSPLAKPIPEHTQDETSHASPDQPPAQDNPSIKESP